MRSFFAPYRSRSKIAQDPQDLSEKSRSRPHTVTGYAQGVPWGPNRFHFGVDLEKSVRRDHFPRTHLSRTIDRTSRRGASDQGENELATGAERTAVLVSRGDVLQGKHPIDDRSKLPFLGPLAELA